MQISFQNVHINQSERLQQSQTTKPKQDRQAGSIDMPALTVNIFAVATNRTNIHSKAGS
jgi:hypothetical protein